jgi:HD-like signal output (HDOD) protein
LLHQIGTLALIQYDSKKYNQVIQLVQNEEMTDLEAEEELFGVNNIIIGEKLANSWKLPDELIYILTHYFHPENNGQGFNKELAAVVGLADILSEINGADFFQKITEQDITLYKPWIILAESYDVLNQYGSEFLTEDIDEQLKKSSEFLSAIK